MGILIKNGKLLTFSQLGIFEGDISIVGDRIEAVDRSIEPSLGDKIIDATGKIVMPGLIQGHVHLCQTLARGFAEDLERSDWLEKRIIPYELGHNYNSMFACVRLGVAELLKSGVTTALDMGGFSHQDVIFDAAITLGLRLFSGMVIADNHQIWAPAKNLPISEKQMLNAREMIFKFHNQPLVEYVLCPRFLLAVSPSMWKKIVELSEKYKIRIHTQASEILTQAKKFREKYGVGEIEALHKLGALNEKTFIAHCVHLAENEYGILRDSGAAVLHCPSSNMKLASGIADITKMIDTGIKVMLGSDSAACNNRLDIWHDIRLAALLQKSKHGASAVSAEKILGLVTADAADSLGIPSGRIEPEKYADLIILDLDRLQTIGPLSKDIFARILYSASPDNVDTVIVAGRKVIEKGIFVSTNINKILIEAKRNVPGMNINQPDD